MIALGLDLDSVCNATPIGGMTATVSPDGRVLLPPELSEGAHLQPGDRLEAQLYKGTLVLRKRQPLSPAQCAALLESSRGLPETGPVDETAVTETIREVRARRG